MITAGRLIGVNKLLHPNVARVKRAALLLPTFIGELFYYRSSLLEEQRPATLIEREVQPRKVHIHQEEQHRRILTAGVVSSL